MCRRPAIRSTSGLTTRATDLISRRARGPSRMAFASGDTAWLDAAWLDAAWPGACSESVVWTVAGRPRTALMGTSLLPDPPACHHQDERHGGDVTGTGSGLDPEVPQLARVRDQVQLGDPAAHDGEPDHGDRVVVGAEQGAGLAVDQHRPGQVHEPRGGAENMPGHRAGPGQRWARLRAAGAGIRAEDHLGVEHPHQRLEVAGPRRRQEGVDDPALERDVAVRLRGGLYPAAGPAGELAGRVRAPPHDPGDLVEGHREDVV